MTRRGFILWSIVAFGSLPAVRLFRDTYLWPVASQSRSNEESWWNRLLIVADRRNTTTSGWFTQLHLPELHFQAVDHVGSWNAEGSANPWKEMVQACHDKQLKVLSYLSIEVERDAFGEYYASLPDDKKWRYKDGSIITDPFEGGAAKNLLGEPCGHWHIYQGKPIPGANMVTLSLHNPNFLTWQLDSVRMHLDAGADGLEWVNPDMEPFSVTGDFSEWANEAFKEYLEKRFDQAGLRTLEIRDTATFDMATYLLAKYAKNGASVLRVDPSASQVQISTGASVFDDRLVREWVKFQRLTLIDFFRKLNGETLKLAKESGKTVAVRLCLQLAAGRAMFSELSTPLISKCFDIIGVVVNTKDYASANYVPEWSPSYRLEPLYKAAKALAGKEKPVWAYSQWTLDIPKTVSHTATNLRKLTIAEGYTQGGIREIPLVDWEADFKLSKSPPELQRYLKFIWENQRYFGGEISKARVGVVYSVPSFLWSICPLFDAYGYWQRASLHGFARALEDGHVPYDMIIFGHPELYDDQSAIESLNQYDLLILPNVHCISDKQIETIKEFVKRGGAIIASGEVATRDEDHVKRGTNVLSELAGLGGSRVIHLPNQPENTYWENVIVNGTNDAKDLNTILNAVYSASKPLQIIGDTGKMVSARVVQQTDPFPRVIVHLMNYNYAFQDDSVKTQENILVTTQLPTNFEMGNVEILSPDDSASGISSAPTLNTPSDGAIEITVPRLVLWSMIVIRTKEEIQIDTSTKVVLEDASQAVSTAKTQGRTVGLTVAEMLLEAANQAYLVGNYEEASEIAAQAKEAADKTTQQGNLTATTTTGTTTTTATTGVLQDRLLIAIEAALGIGVTAIGAIVYALRRRQSRTGEDV